MEIFGLVSRRVMLGWVITLHPNRVPTSFVELLLETIVKGNGGEEHRSGHRFLFALFGFTDARINSRN